MLYVLQIIIRVHNLVFREDGIIAIADIDISKEISRCNKRGGIKE
jgi:hypothetical protein